MPEPASSTAPPSVACTEGHRRCWASAALGSAPGAEGAGRPPAEPPPSRRTRLLVGPSASAANSSYSAHRRTSRPSVPRGYLQADEGRGQCVGVGQGPLSPGSATTTSTSASARTTARIGARWPAGRAEQQVGRRQRIIVCGQMAEHGVGGIGGPARTEPAVVGGHYRQPPATVRWVVRAARRSRAARPSLAPHSVGATNVPAPATR